MGAEKASGISRFYHPIRARQGLLEALRDGRHGSFYPNSFRIVFNINLCGNAVELSKTLLHVLFPETKGAGGSDLDWNQQHPFHSPAQVTVARSITGEMGGPELRVDDLLPLPGSS